LAKSIPFLELSHLETSFAAVQCDLDVRGSQDYDAILSRKCGHCQQEGCLFCYSTCEPFFPLSQREQIGLLSFFEAYKTVLPLNMFSRSHTKKHIAQVFISFAAT
jgi:hypothetical protein